MNLSKALGLLHYVPPFLVYPLARRFITGKSFDSALRCAKKLKSLGFKIIINYGGEDFTNKKDISEADLMYRVAILNTAVNDLPADVSLKLSQFGVMEQRSILKYTWTSNFPELAAIIKEARLHRVRLWLDAEHLETRRNLWNLINWTLPENPFLGVALQVYGKDSFDSLDFFENTAMYMARHVPKDTVLGIRLCKGAYNDPSTLRDSQEIRARYYQLVEKIFKYIASGQISDSVFFEFATHDEWLIYKVKILAKYLGVPENHFRFAMLYGRVPSLASHLVKEGYTVAIYLLFGRWYPYFVRRIKEKPAYLFLPFRREGKYHICHEWPRWCNLLC